MQPYIDVGNTIPKATATNTQLFHRHAPAIFAFLRQQTSSREDAEDLLLEVFTAALEHKQLHMDD